jgi:hypothetical protein
MLSSQPQILEVGSTPSDTHFSSMATHQIPCTNLRLKNKILADSFKQVAGETGLAPPDLIPSKSALPVSFGQIYIYSQFIWVPK